MELELIGVALAAVLSSCAPRAPDSVAAAEPPLEPIAQPSTATPGAAEGEEVAAPAIEAARPVIDERVLAWETAKHGVLARISTPATARFPDTPSPGAGSIASALHDQTIAAVSVPPNRSQADDDALGLADDFHIPSDEQEAFALSSEDSSAARERWRFVAWVDCQNTFGALVRQHYDARVLVDGGHAVVETVVFLP